MVSAAKKSSSAKATAALKKAAPAHPTWADMIKECIAVHKDDARIGVSRPQIKKFVEERYKIEIGAAQNAQLSKAITRGEEKGEFSLPKGITGRVKLAPKNRTPKEDTSAAKENKKPVAAKKPVASKKVGAVKTAKKSIAKTGTTTKKATTARKPAAAAVDGTLKRPHVTPTTARGKAVAAKNAAAVADKDKADRKNKKAKAAPATAAPEKKVVEKRKVVAGKPKAVAKKTAATSRRGVAKKAATGTAATSKAKPSAAKPAAKAKATPAKKTAAAPAKSTSSRRKYAAKK